MNSTWRTWLDTSVMKRTDLIVSLIIGELASLLMLGIGRNLALPPGAAKILPSLPFWFPFLTLAVMLAGSWIGRYRLSLYQLAKFGLVGGLNFLIDLGVLNLLIALSGVAAGFYASVFKAVAFLTAVVSSFIWNKFWTFRQLSTEHVGVQFAEFFGVSAIGLVINVTAFAFFNDLLGPPAGFPPRLWASASAAAAAIAGLLWNFFGYKFVVFRRGRG